ncbi:hypothetical protein ROHU_030332 [Labeo rohita]|uniref:Uncharacterized protein n=1 Tax=Labeo rohita TaxID=84645 RepID=A0A498LVV0_LABRO|nr:hypothetical protein ROHU_030332 [Labeo rohita]
MICEPQVALVLRRKAAPCTRELQISSCPHARSLAAANNQHPASKDSSHTLSINYRLERAHVVRSKGQQQRLSVCVLTETEAQGPPAPFNML